MTEPLRDVAADVTELLVRYGFEFDGCTVEQRVDQWLRSYPTRWLRLAVVEALYQGRYKLFSVEQILNLWQRRGNPIYHFNREFERIICGRSLNPFLSQVESHPPVKPIPKSVKADRVPPSRSMLPEQISEQIPESLEANPAIPSFNVEETRFPYPVASEANYQVIETGGNETEAIEAAIEANATNLIDEPAQSNSDNGSRESENPLLLNTGSSLKPGEVSIEPFKPEANGISALVEEIIQIKAPTGQYPIDQFVPTPEPSEFYSKLKAVAQETPPTHSHSTASDNKQAEPENETPPE